MVQVHVMIGAPVSGKSTYAQEQREEQDKAVVLSSDYIREAIPEIKDDNAEVFRVMNKALRTHIKDGYFEHIYYDATNTNRRRRRTLYRNIKSWDENAEVNAILFSVPYEVAVERNSKRDRQVPNDVILRMHRQLQVPRIGVDCDRIGIEGIPIFKYVHDDMESPTTVENIFEHMNEEWVPEISLSDTPHETPWHQESVFEHINMAIDNADTNTLKKIALWHDLGKGRAKRMKSGVAIYRNHADISAHYLFNYLHFTKPFLLEIDDMEVLSVVYHHMHFHNGIGEKNRRNNRISDYVMSLGEKFAEIDSASKIMSDDAFLELYGEDK